MHIQPESERLTVSFSKDGDGPFSPDLTVPSSSPEGGEVPPGKLPSFDGGLMESRAWIKLVLWVYRLVLCIAQSVLPIITPADRRMNPEQ